MDSIHFPIAPELNDRLHRYRHHQRRLDTSSARVLAVRRRRADDPNP